MAVLDKFIYQVNGDDSSLGMRSHEDDICGMKIVDPFFVPHQVCIVSVHSDIE